MRVWPQWHQVVRVVGFMVCASYAPFMFDTPREFTVGTGSDPVVLYSAGLYSAAGSIELNLLNAFKTCSAKRILYVLQSTGRCI